MCKRIEIRLYSGVHKIEFWLFRPSELRILFLSKQKQKHKYSGR